MTRALPMQESRRQRMVSEQLIRRDIVDPGVLAAFGSVPREQFVPGELGPQAYDDAAILGTLAREVETVERIAELAAAAAERLARLGYTNVHVHHGDGSLGWL